MPQGVYLVTFQYDDGNDQFPWDYKMFLRYYRDKKLELSVKGAQQSREK